MIDASGTNGTTGRPARPPRTESHSPPPERPARRPQDAPPHARAEDSPPGAEDGATGLLGGQDAGVIPAAALLSGIREERRPDGPIAGRPRS